MKKAWYLINDGQLRGSGSVGGQTIPEWESLNKAKESAKQITEGNGKITYVLELVGVTKIPVEYEAVYEESQN